MRSRDRRSRSCCSKLSANSCSSRSQLGEDGKLLYPELVFGAIKKSGKTTLAGIIVLVMILLFGGRFAEGYCVANDLEQAQSRVFMMIKRICEASPLLSPEAVITANKIAFPHSVQRSPRSRATMQVQQAAIQRLLVSTNFGLSPSNAVADSGTR